MRDVRDVVSRLLEPSPNRQSGTHPAQPVLVRAGPGTGKTWMVKQALYTLASRLMGKSSGGGSSSGGGGGKLLEGVRLVPVIVYVQRIVRLLREASEDEVETQQMLTSRQLLRFYIESEFGGPQNDTCALPSWPALATNRPPAPPPPSPPPARLLPCTTLLAPFTAAEALDPLPHTAGARCFCKPSRCARCWYSSTASTRQPACAYSSHNPCAQLPPFSMLTAHRHPCTLRHTGMRAQIEMYVHQEAPNGPSQPPRTQSNP